MAQRRDALARKGMNAGRDIERVLELIGRIARESAGGDYLYRGERKCHPEVSSSLYRQYEEIEAEEFNIEEVQKEILKEAQRHTRKTDELEILAELQHYGGNTNLIDFTTDYLIALFFACDGEPDEDGRVVLMRKSEEIRLYEPKTPENRVIAQKSVFFQPPKGYIGAKDWTPIKVPKDLKRPILEHLRKQHGISPQTIYNDIHGFIKTQRIYESAYTEFYRGLTCQNQGKLKEAIQHYNEAIRLNPQIPASYNNRGNTYYKKRESDLAIQDYSKAIELDPQGKEAYYNRGNAYMKKRESDLAIRDLNRAIELDPLYREAYNNRGNVYVAKGKLDLALRDFNKAIELDPQDEEAYNNRGEAYMKRGQLDLAIPDYDKAIELDPNCKEAYYNRGIAWLRRQKWGKAKADLTMAKDLGMDVAAQFKIEYGSVEGFEGKLGVKLPEDIAALLR